MFATAKRKARDAAGRETVPAVPCSKVQLSNTNKLARFTSVDVDQRSMAAGAAVTAAGLRTFDDASSALPTRVSGGLHFAAAGDGCSSAPLPVYVSKRASHDPDLSSANFGTILSLDVGNVAVGVGAGAKRISAFTVSPPHAGSPPRSSGSGSSSPVAALSKRASDDTAHKSAGGRALEKRTNDGNQHAQRDRRNSE